MSTFCRTSIRCNEQMSILCRIFQSFAEAGLNFLSELKHTLAGLFWSTKSALILDIQFFGPHACSRILSISCHCGSRSPPLEQDNSLHFDLPLTWPLWILRYFWRYYPAAKRHLQPWTSLNERSDQFNWVSTCKFPGNPRKTCTWASILWTYKI